MKKVALLLMLITFAVSAQHTNSALRLGYFSPKVTDGGFILGYQWDRIVDENFNVGFEMDWFKKTYIDEAYVNELNTFNSSSGQIGELNELRAKTNLHDFPMMFTMNITFPLENKLKVFAEGGLGLDFLFVYYRSYQSPDDDNLKVAADFSWRLGAGLSYPIGRRSDVMFSLNYHSSEPSWEYEVTDNTRPGSQKRVFVRSYDMSGFMARVGFRFFY
ncbi:MAG: outer membrane beta-barrel protein [Ignavibacteriales bacterium]|nr:outer membrane beta-barrel protein [Ignavibacteriales bacterium]